MGDVELAALAERQEGLVTRPQTRAHLSREQVKQRLETGVLTTVRWGVYRYAGAPRSRWQELRAACLAGGPDAVASHRAAAALWGMPGVICEQPEITVPSPHWPRLPGVKSHQTTRLPREHRSVREGVPVTSAARTLADLASIFPAAFLGRLTDGCLRRGLTTVSELHATYDVLATQGRRLGAFAEVLARRPLGYDPGGSGAELDVCAVLVDAGLPRPLQQYQVVIGGTVYVLDFAYPDLRIGMEYDGYAFHRLPSDLDHAAVRGNAFELAGWMVLHFTASTPRRRIVADVVAARDRSLRAIGGPEPQLRGDVEGWAG